MKKVILLFAALIFSATSAFSQTDTTNYWASKGNAQLLLNQASFTNWVQGGNNSISATALLNYSFSYNDSITIWENFIDLGYGVIRTDEFGVRKNEDKIDILSNYNYRATKNLFYTGKFNFKSQFVDGFNYPDDTTVVSDFLAPAFVILSAGMTYRPNEDFSFYFSPATGKFTIVNDERLSDAGAYGVIPGEMFRAEFGAFATLEYRKALMENIVFRTKLDLFNNFTDPNKDNRTNIDVNWENSINMTVNKYISVNIFAHLIYDHDIDVPIFEEQNGEDVQVGVGPRLQVKQILGLGFSYNF